MFFLPFSGLQLVFELDCASIVYCSGIFGNGRSFVWGSFPRDFFCGIVSGQKNSAALWIFGRKEPEPSRRSMEDWETGNLADFDIWMFLASFLRIFSMEKGTAGAKKAV